MQDPKKTAEKITYDDAPDKFESELKNTIISDIMKLEEREQIELWKELYERGFIRL